MFIPLGVVFIMFCLGLGLTLDDFTRVIRQPFAFLIGATHQLILLPLLTYCLILFFGISGELAVGFMIIAACPGGVISNVLTRLAGWDVALSVSLTAVMSLVCIITLPIILGVSLNHFMGLAAPEISIASTALRLFLMTALPIALGMALRRFAPGLVERFELAVTRVAFALFALIITAAITAGWDLIMANISQVGLVLVTLMVLLTILGRILPKWAGLSAKQANTISIETSVQNAPLGIAVAALLVGASEGLSGYAIPASVYGVVWYFVVGPMLLALLYGDKKTSVLR